jgi:hypothetical protein
MNAKTEKKKRWIMIGDLGMMAAFFCVMVIGVIWLAMASTLLLKASACLIVVSGIAGMDDNRPDTDRSLEHFLLFVTGPMALAIVLGLIHISIH